MEDKKNISKIKNTPKKFSLPEHDYQLLFENNPIPMWLVTKEDRSIIAVNQAAVDTYGYTMDELLLMSLKYVQHQGPIKNQSVNVQNSRSDSAHADLLRYIKKDGTIIYTKVIAHDIAFEGRQVRLLLTYDLTEEFKAKDALQKSRANLHAILQATDISYFLFDLDLRVFAYNQNAMEFAYEKYNCKLEAGAHLTDYLPPDRFRRFINIAVNVLKGLPAEYEISYRPSAQAISWYSVKLIPITDTDQILGMMILIRNITESKIAKQDLLNAYNMIKSQYNDLQNMSWRQSHLLRSPLANLKGLVQTLIDTPSDKFILDYIQKELKKLDAVIINMAQNSFDGIYIDPV